jgi:transposase
MVIIAYYENLRLSTNPYGWRMKMMDSVKTIGIKPTAKEFKTTVKTVKKWHRQYLIKGLDGLLDKSRKPKNPRTIPKVDEEKIVALRKQRKNRISCWGIKTALKLPYSTSTIYRVLRQHPDNLIGKQKRKHQKKKDLREIKAKLKPFEKIQMDVKYLDDIPQYFKEYIKYKLPRYEFTARCEKTGAVFISYAYEKNNINAASFVTYIMEHLKRHGITIADVNIQTDNGSEFCGNWTPRSNSLFTHMIEKVYGTRHLRIPRGKPNVNADVETFHRIVENHFYDLETYSGLVDFLNKAYTYQIIFNYFRPNSYKWGMTPLKILNKSNSHIDPAVLSLPPIILDFHNMLYLRKLNPDIEVDHYQKDLLRGYDVPDSPVRCC